MDFKRPKGVEMSLDISPLIDVVFMLLLFFMLTSNFVTDSGIELKLPEATTGENQELNEPLVIYVDQQQQIFLDQQELKIEQLHNLLTQKLVDKQSKKVVLKADKSVPMGFVVKIMDIARQSNGEDLVISTEQVAGVSDGGK
ncbi:ExbD/TolR family protein [Orenia marismortui]|uniref:ExbD/TolR family protein n=1 Tax=Orenia marismortui TaxID=46469 RepID=UPI0003771859|nr:biopolymer transporter ExbD [Orenia marismortui]